MAITIKNTRFVLPTANRTINATLINGVGAYTGGPSLSQDAQYPMSNLLVNDRLAIWRSASGLAGGFKVEFDLGVDRDIDVIGLHGIRYAATSTLPASFDVGLRTAAQGYGTTFTAVKTATAIANNGFGRAVRDVGFQLAAPKRGRYWQFAFGSVFGGFSIANFMLAKLSYDIGFLYSPGANDSLSRSRIRTRTMMGHPVLTQLGDDRRLFTMAFNLVEKSKADVFRTLAAQEAPITFLNPFDEFFQIEMAGEEHQSTHDWTDGNGHYLSTIFDVESLA